MSRCYHCQGGFKSAGEERDIPPVVRAADPSIPLTAICHEKCKGPLRAARSKQAKNAPVSAGMRSRGPPAAPPRPSFGGWGTAGLGAGTADAVLSERRDSVKRPRCEPQPPMPAQAGSFGPMPTSSGGKAAAAGAAGRAKAHPALDRERLRLLEEWQGGATETLPRCHERGGIATALRWEARREATGAAAKAAALAPEERVAVGSRCAWAHLTEAEAKERGKAEATRRGELEAELKRAGEKLGRKARQLRDATAERDTLRAAKSAEAKKVTADQGGRAKPPHAPQLTTTHGGASVCVSGVPWSLFDFSVTWKKRFQWWFQRAFCGSSNVHRGVQCTVQTQTSVTSVTSETPSRAEPSRPSGSQ